MARKNLEKMKENLEKEINGFIMGGLNGGFQFDEEQAQYLQELQDMMIYIFDALEQSISITDYQSEVRSEIIVKLKEESVQDEFKIIGLQTGLKIKDLLVQNVTSRLYETRNEIQTVLDSPLTNFSELHDAIQDILDKQ